MEEKINEVLNTIRPYLNSDGGNVEFIKYADGIAYVKLTGGCSQCPHKNQTLQSLILGTLKEEIPEIIDVINVEL